MHLTRSTFLIASLGLGSALIGGCGGPDKALRVSDPNQTPVGKGIPKLVTKDIVIGKPSRFVKSMTPLEAGDIAFVRYKGTFLTGEIFDTNARDGGVYALTIGNSEVIKGWDQGLPGMLIGGKRKLEVPDELGYADTGNGKIPPRTDIYFEVELIDMIKRGQDNTYHIIDVVKGSGRPAKLGDTVTVEYELRAAGLERVVDSTQIQRAEGAKKNKRFIDPTFVLGDQSALPGIEEAIVDMRLGGIREVRFPPVLAPTNIKTLKDVPDRTVWYAKLKLIGLK